MGEADLLMDALSASRRKITVFLFTVFTLVVVFGSAMYLIEGEDNGFTSIPKSIYWAIVTMTTVGYGDISPRTPFGQLVASFVMIMGYAIIAVPTGIVTMELTRPTGAVPTPEPARSAPQRDTRGKPPTAGVAVRTFIGGSFFRIRVTNHDRPKAEVRPPFGQNVRPFSPTPLQELGSAEGDRDEY